jgi:hypothetical protein
MTSVPTTEIAELLAQRAAASASAETASSTSGKAKAEPDPDSPFEVVSPPAGGSVVESTGGGEDQGENLVDSLLVDSAQSAKAAVMITSGSRGQSRTSTDSEAVVTSSNTPKSSSSKFKLVLVTSEVKDSFCCGVISSNKNDFACAKDADGCGITSHAKKHEEVKVNHLYIMMYNPASPNRTCRLFNLTELKESVHESDIMTASEKVMEMNDELDEIDAGIEEAIKIFKRLISDLIEAKYKNLSTIHSSPEHENMLLTEPAFDFDQDIEEMVSAREVLDLVELKKEAILKVEDKNQDSSSVDSSTSPGLTSNAEDDADSHSKKNVVASIFEKSGNRISTRTKTAKILGDNAISTRSSGDNTQVPPLVLTSGQFVQDLASSKDQGVAVMKAFYQKVLDLELYSKRYLNNKISRINRRNEEIDHSVKMLINPGPIVP